MHTAITEADERLSIILPSAIGHHTIRGHDGKIAALLLLRRKLLNLIESTHDCNRFRLGIITTPDASLHGIVARA